MWKLYECLNYYLIFYQAVNLLILSLFLPSFILSFISLVPTNLEGWVARDQKINEGVYSLMREIGNKTETKLSIVQYSNVLLIYIQINTYLFSNYASRHWSWAM